MPLGVKLPSGTVVNVEDLPLVVWEGIARAGGLEVREWPHVAMAPGGYPKAANELIAVCARHVGEDEPPAGYLTLGNLAAVFHEIAEEPDPKVAGDPETTG